MERTKFQVEEAVEDKFAHKDTMNRICFELLPLVGQIASDEFMAQTTMCTSFTGADKIDCDDAANLFISIIAGYLNRVKAWQMDFWVCFGKLLEQKSGYDFEDKLDAFRNMR